MPLIGGTSSWLGPVVGAVLVGGLQEYMAMCFGGPQEEFVRPEAEALVVDARAARLRIGKTPESDVALSAGSITISAVNVWSRSATSLGGGSGKPSPIAPGANAFGASVRAAISAEIWKRTVRGVALAATSAVNASEMLKL